MIDEQMTMYMNGTAEKLAAEVKQYEIEQYRIAFMEGTDKAWKRYHANVIRRVNKVNKATGISLDADAIMS